MGSKGVCQPGAAALSSVTTPEGRADFSVDRGKTLRDLALEKMRGAIFDGHLQPGERLVERHLCEQLRVSRSIVREVLRHLVAEGLVESMSPQGLVVATLTADQAAQIYQIRALLEGHAARICAERASDEEIEQLAELNERIQVAFRDEDLHEVMRRTGAFYDALFNVSGLTIAFDIVQSLNARINRLRILTISSSGRRAEAAEEMAQIVNALRKRDPDAAEQASHRHMRRVAEIATKRLSHSKGRTAPDS